MSDIPLSMFEFETDGLTYEDLANANGSTWWYYSDLLRSLGYATSTDAPLRRAQQACLSLAIDILGETMIRTTGTQPEDLPLAEDLRVVKRDIKKSQQRLKKIDATKKGK